jgi:hypothetical protein
MASGLKELIALSLLAGFAFGLALDRGDLIFVTVFGAACAMARQRGHLSFKLVSRAKLVPYPVSLRLVFAHCGSWANDHCVPSIYGIWHHL